MNKPLKRVLHIFRRDLRLQDNTALIAALESAEVVIPCFFFDPRQITLNAYAGDHALAFMAKSLTSLKTQLNEKNGELNFFEGEPEKLLPQLITTLQLEGLSFNRDYTPFSQQRDEALIHIAKQHQLKTFIFDDALLHPPGCILKPDGNPYTIFTPFFKRALTHPVSLPQKNTYDNYFNQSIALSTDKTLTKLLKKQTPAMLTPGGREAGYTLLRDIVHLDDYAKTRDIPSVRGTSLLAAHHKFGTISIRETHARVSRYLGSTHTLITELHWRDFFTHIAFHFPHVFKGCFHSRYDNLSWKNDESAFRAWCEGRTGFPIVDAGMRQLNETGYMHNRVRMITASFLTKDLHIDWRLGERYFATQLTDYDPAVNNGNWQWAASTGCDAQPYFRIFNPWRQQEKFDPDCLYIKRFIPELARYEPKIIHALAEKQPANSNYPQPIVDHNKESKIALSLYKNIK